HYIGEFNNAKCWVLLQYAHIKLNYYAVLVLVYENTSSSNTWNDMINSNVKLCAIQIPLSTGYFFADMFDFLIKNIFMDSPGIWLHHILVVGVLISSISTCKYFPYLTATLLVEI
ncbi:788_t:CDS:2, partial [Entrophospora sp. SA101]